MQLRHRSSMCLGAGPVRAVPRLARVARAAQDSKQQDIIASAKEMGEKAVKADKARPYMHPRAI